MEKRDDTHYSYIEWKYELGNPPSENAPAPPTPHSVQEAIPGGCRPKEKKVVKKERPFPMPPPQQSDSASSSDDIFSNPEASLAPSHSLRSYRGAPPLPPPISSIPERPDINLTDNRENLGIPCLSVSSAIEPKIKKKPKKPKKTKKTFTPFTDSLSNLTNKLAKLFTKTEDSNADKQYLEKHKPRTSPCGQYPSLSTQGSGLERHVSINSLYGQDPSLSTQGSGLERHVSINSLYGQDPSLSTQGSGLERQRSESINSLYQTSETDRSTNRLFLRSEEPEYANPQTIQNSMRQNPRSQNPHARLFGP